MGDDWMTGLKTLLYMQTLEGVDDWDGQSPPTARTYKGKPVIDLQSALGKNLPNFGPFAKEKANAIANMKKNEDLLDDKYKPTPNRPANKQRVIALIDPEMCINCGKCYMTCNDTGYQAIS